jgi:hypothetical protein
MKMIMATDSSKSDHQETIIDQDQFKPAKWQSQVCAVSYRLCRCDPDDWIWSPCNIHGWVIRWLIIYCCTIDDDEPNNRITEINLWLTSTASQQLLGYVNKGNTHEHKHKVESCGVAPAVNTWFYRLLRDWEWSAVDEYIRTWSCAISGGATANWSRVHSFFKH